MREFCSRGGFFFLFNFLLFDKGGFWARSQLKIFFFYPFPPTLPPRLPLPFMTNPSLRPHTLPPITLYLAHLAPYLAATHTQLVAQIAATQAENESLARRIEAQRNAAGELLQGLERVVRDLEGANELLGECVAEVAKVEESGDLETR